MLLKCVCMKTRNPIGKLLRNALGGTNPCNKRGLEGFLIAFLSMWNIWDLIEILGFLIAIKML